MLAPLCVSFIGGAAGAWRIERINAERGESLALTERLDVREGDGVALLCHCSWGGSVRVWQVTS